MDQKFIDEITGRAISDLEFRKKLSADPKQALREAGYPLEGQEELLKTLEAATSGHPEALASEYEKGFPGMNDPSGPMG